MPDKNRFLLNEFLPYQLAVLNDNVSKSIAQLYTERYHLSRAEWRVLAALGECPNMNSRELVTYTKLDKMQVSRAVVKLEKAGNLLRHDDEQDARNKRLCLSNTGHQLLKKIIPLVQAREDYLLEVLSDAELKQYQTLNARILSRAKLLTKNG